MLRKNCTVDALLMHIWFFTKFTNIKKTGEKIRNFFPSSKFTKLVNLLVLETQGIQNHQNEFIPTFKLSETWDDETNKQLGLVVVQPTQIYR